MAQQPSEVRKKQLRNAIIGFVGFGFVIAFGLWVSDPNKGKPSKYELAKLREEEVQEKYRLRASDSVTDEDQWIAKSEERLAALEIALRRSDNEKQALERKLTALEGQLNANGQAVDSGDREPRDGGYTQVPLQVPTETAGGSKVALDDPLPPAPEPMGLSVDQPEPGDYGQEKGVLPTPTPPGPPTGGRGADRQGDAIVHIDLGGNSRNKKNDKRLNIAGALPAGTFGRAVLLSGMDAPTLNKGQSNPIPALFQMKDLGNLPNFFESDIENCFVVAEGWGDISSERAKYRLLTLSCVLDNGDIVDADLKGTVVGEDGKEGLRGKLVERNGSLLAKTFMAGGLAGISKVAAQSYQTQSTSALGTVITLDPDDIGKAGAAEGFGTAAEKLADYYMQRANEIFPIIEISPERIAEIFLTESVDLKVVLKGNINNAQGEEIGGDYYEYDDSK